MKLFIVHVGFYDHEIGIYELHTNFLVAAESVSDVKSIVKAKEIFKTKKMHIDAVQEIDVVDGYRVTLAADHSSDHKITTYDYTDIKQL